MPPPAVLDRAPPEASPPAPPSIAERLRESRAAQAAWAALPVRARVAIIRAARHALAARAVPVAAAVRPDAPLAEALAGEVLPLLDAARFLERRAERILRPRRGRAGGAPAWLGRVAIEVRRIPFGAVLIIGPSNLPFFLTGAQALQALVAGNAVVLKPGRGGAGAAGTLREALVEGGLDPRLFQVLGEPVEEARAAIRAGPDKVVLTGSAETGRAVLADLAPRLIPAALELSGCDPVIVLPGADLDRLARALAFGLSWNGGEMCIAPRRVLAPPGLLPEIERRLGAAARSLRPRPARAGSPSRALGLVREAVAAGARLVAGGRLLPDGSGLEPTVLAGVPAGARILEEDPEAPVLVLVEAGGPEEALRLAEAGPFFLGASIFGSEGAARALAARLRAGSVVVNDLIAPTADPRLPFGGAGRSGFGVTRGAEGLLEMTRPRALAIRRGAARHLDGTRPGDEILFGSWAVAAHGGRLRDRVRAALTLAAALLRRRERKAP